MDIAYITVKQLNLYARSLFEGDPRLSNITVKGEISNFKNHYQSGHLYFTLKDSDASIKAVMFRFNAAFLKFDLYDGLQVIVRGKVSIYEKDGQYQLYAEEIIPEGIGDIALKFNQIKERLEKEGLFDTATKRPIPKFPKKIAVITSKTGAAIQDILNILGRRWPIAQVILCPVSVQGELAVGEMLACLDELYKKDGIDVAIIGRGGGSIEDLWAFNDETLARKIYEAPFPIISAVGHETDFTICDFVADLRAPTPSAAAELAVPDMAEILNLIESKEATLKKDLLAKLNLNKQRLNTVLSSFVFKNPLEFFINRRKERLDRDFDLLNERCILSLKSKQNVLTEKIAKLDALSPLKVLTRGYAAVSVGGKTVSSVQDISRGDTLSIRLIDGVASTEVHEIVKGEN